MTHIFLYGDCLSVIVSSSHRLSGGCFRTLGPSDSPKGKNLGEGWVGGGEGL